jgi:predicted Zn-dependent peptidase
MTAPSYKRLAFVAAVFAAVTLAPTLPKVTFTDTRLKNGLRLIVAEDHNAPVYSIVVSYNVGSRDERKGGTGLAHILEHMMFKGSANVGPGEHYTLVLNNGGDPGRGVTKDRTTYYETLPANQLDLGLFLEADRMRSLAITKENLDSQRNSVQEELRRDVDNRPYGKTNEAIDSLAYDSFAYEHSVHGSMQDLNAASVEDVAAFFKKYYAPNNAAVGIVGDVKTADVLAKARTYFEPIPSQSAPPKVDMDEPPQKAERRLALDDPLARLSRVDVAYKVPPSMSPDDDALTVLVTVLGGRGTFRDERAGQNRSSRLYKQLVWQKQLASNVGSFIAESRGPGLFRVWATVMPAKDAADVEAAIYQEIEKIKSVPIADWEMEKARAAARRNLVASLQSSHARADQLTQYARFYDDPGLINTRAERLAAVTPADVQRVARQHLTPEHRTVVITNPKPAASK